MHIDDSIDDELAGTTAISVVFMDKRIFVSNVGDSRAIICSLSADGRLVSRPLSNDQTPYRKDERERVKGYGARILSMDQLEGIEPVHENWAELKLGEDIDEGGDPPRIWSPDGDYPGTAFTRSLGDSVAEVLGVIPEPEIQEYELRSDDLFLVVASDGVYEFLTNQMVADIVFSNSDINKGCKEVVENAYEQWLQYEVRTDDITMIALHLKDAAEMSMTASMSAPQSIISNPQAFATEVRPSMASLANSYQNDYKLRSFSVEESRPIRRAKRASKTNFIINRDSLHDNEADVDNSSALAAVSSSSSNFNAEGSMNDADTNGGVVVDVDVTTLPEYQKTKDEKALLAKALKNVFLFKHLDDAQLETVLVHMKKHTAVKGDVIIRQGDPGNQFYIVQTGIYEARVVALPIDSCGLERPSFAQDSFSFNSAPDIKSLSMLGSTAVQTYQATKDKHPSFGELALLYDKPRAATVTAMTDGVLWSLDRKIFRNSLVSGVKTRKNILRMFRRISVLKCVPTEKLQRLADLLSEVRFSYDEFIYKEGQKIDHFYIVVSGDCDVCVPAPEDDPDAGMTVVKILHPRDYFGERTMADMGESFSRYHVVAASKTVKCLRLSIQQIESVLGPVDKLIESFNTKYEKALAAGSGLSSSPTNFRNITLNSVVSSDGIGTLILGTFGSVLPNLTVRTFLLTETDEQQRSNAVLNYVDVCKLLAFADYETPLPFVPRLFSLHRVLNAFHLLFNKPVICDLKTLIARLTEEHSDDLNKPVLHHKQTLPNDMIQYIVASIILTLASLHRVGIFYRNVNLEGIHVDGTGKLAFVDYMNSKISAKGNKTYTLCGVADYLSPEQIAQTGHTEAVDLWSLGVLLYELCSGGTNPFHCESEIKTYERISSLGTKAFPKAQPRNSTKGTSSSLDSLVEALLQPVPENRLGMKGGGKDLIDLKAHVFFKGINWNTLGSPSDKPSPLLEAAKAELEVILNPPIDPDELDGAEAAEALKGVPPEVIDNWNSAYVGSGWDEEIDVSCPV